MNTVWAIRSSAALPQLLPIAFAGLEQRDRPTAAVEIYLALLDALSDICLPRVTTHPAAVFSPRCLFSPRSDEIKALCFFLELCAFFCFVAPIRALSKQGVVCISVPAMQPNLCCSSTCGRWGGVVLMILHSVAMRSSPSHPHKGGTAQAGLSPDQARTRSPSAKRCGVFGELHEG